MHAKTYQWNKIARGGNLTALGFLKPISRQKMYLYLQLKDVAKKKIPPNPFLTPCMKVRSENFTPF